MKFQISLASDLVGERQPSRSAVKDGIWWYVEIGTLDDLMALIAEVKCELVVGDEPRITIYDDYIE